MKRLVSLLALILFLPGNFFLLASPDDGPPISITSPDTGTTFAFATIKNHALLWSHNALFARVTFTDSRQSNEESQDDTHFFRLPGITFDAARGLYFATSVKGESIPVAQNKKALFFKSVETLPNARVRILYPRGELTVILEAISANDPALRAHPPNSDPDGTHKVEIDKILN